jgi:hypothetical protein
MWEIRNRNVLRNFRLWYTNGEAYEDLFVSINTALSTYIIASLEMVIANVDVDVAFMSKINSIFIRRHPLHSIVLEIHM